MKKLTLSITILAITAAFVPAQFKLKVPKIPKTSKPQTVTQKPVETPVQTTQPARAGRQLVMDDGYTFFDAEPVEEYNSKLRLQQDIGWYLRSDLRLLGTFPERSAFRVVVKKDGKSLSEVRCEGNIYQKATDSALRTEMQRRGKDLGFEDFMYSERCFDKESAIKPVGKFDVEIHFIDGDTDAESLVRTYKIDVHKATRVRGSTTNPQPDVSHYYVQRHAEAAVAFIHLSGTHTGSDRNGRTSYFRNEPSTSSTPDYEQLIVYFSVSRGRSTKSSGSPFLRCSVNGERIRLPRDSVSLGSSIRADEYAIYTDRIAPQFKRGSAYRDDVRFGIYTAALPLYTGEGEYSKPPMKIEDSPGNWECAILSKGVEYRRLRWTVGADGKIAEHPEQTSGNVNLYYKTYLVDMDIAPNGGPFDFRLMPMPAAGLFYGIPWSSAEGKAMAARVPKLGRPFHVPSNKAN